MIKLITAVPVAVWSVVAGIMFTARCEYGPRPTGGWMTCWAIGGAVAGVPLAKRVVDNSRFLEGYNTLNPALNPKRKKYEEEGDGGRLG